MAYSNEELTEKVNAINDFLNKMQQAFLNVASKAQLRQITNLTQRDINDLKDRVKALETEVELLKRQ